MPAMRKKADKLGLVLKRSTRKGKKLDAYDRLTGEKVGSFGALGFGDYPTFMAMESRGELPQGFAKKKRYLYRNRHFNYAALGRQDATPGYLAYMILW